MRWRFQFVPVWLLPPDRSDAEPLPGNCLAILESAVAHTAAGYRRETGDTLCHIGGRQPGFLEQQETVLSLAIGFKAQHLLDPEIRGTGAQPSGACGIAPGPGW